MSSNLDKLLSMVRYAVDDGPSPHIAQDRYSWCFSDTLLYEVKNEIIDSINSLSAHKRKELYDEYINKINATNRIVLDAQSNYSMIYPIPKRSVHHLNSDDFDSLYFYLEELSNWITKKVNPPLPPRKKPRQSFESLFIDNDHPALVKSIFETHGYTEKGRWKGLSSFKYELLSAVWVLIPLLKKTPNTSIKARIFYLEFGYEEDDPSERRLRDEPNNPEMKNDFERIFSGLLKSAH